MTLNDPILEIEGLTKKFGSLTAVDEVSFSVDEGAFIGLIGPNGAGKSTLFDVITGIVDATEGKIIYQGKDVTDNGLQKNAAQGLVRTFQVTRVFEAMTVRENMLVASQLADQPEERADELLEVIELKEMDKVLTEDLSFGQRKLLSIIRVMMLDPDLLLLDEPLAGVNPTMENKIFNLLKKFSEDGVTFIFIEHDMDAVMEMCEEVIVMDAGQLLTRGTPAQVQNNEQVLKAYFGE
jgi:branched-chain amino acid transport system ATP-binding protein